ncbi:MAG: chorismate synthase [Candidatus Lernaella stagnicola]|nr:chorismate synthase [Candidatus Lernaella stagnicola]
MPGSCFGRIFVVTTFGESHGPAIGAIVDGVPAGLPLNEAMIQEDLDRRRPGRSSLVSPRQEKDIVRILSGVFDGKTTGTSIGLLIENRDARSGDYDKVKDTFRPGHADYTYEQKYGRRDWRGSGRSSGRETAARVAAGAIARQVLDRLGIEVIGAVAEIGGVAVNLADDDWREFRDEPLRCPDPAAKVEIEKLLLRVIEQGDSVGGIVAIKATGMPAGLGEPVFDKLDARLGAAMMSIGAVKGVEIGDGFAAARHQGSEAHDSMLRPGVYESNHAGGMVGGISNGADIFLRVAVKPTSSIAKARNTIDRSGKRTQVAVEGRHDPCIAPRLVAVAEAMTCLVLADFVLLQRARSGFAEAEPE